MSCKKRVTDKAVGSMCFILLKVGTNNVFQILKFQMAMNTN